MGMGTAQSRHSKQGRYYNQNNTTIIINNTDRWLLGLLNFRSVIFNKLST